MATQSSSPPFHRIMPLPQPQLLPDLHLSLACLYGLPHPHCGGDYNNVSLHQAQEYLIHFQARNIRRKLASLVQRQRDKTKQQQQQQIGGLYPAVPQLQTPVHANSDSKASGPEGISTGSSWLACLALLCQQQQTLQHQPSSSSSWIPFAASDTERLFAAQTLLHRLMRSKLDQAIDVEIEIPTTNENDSHLPNNNNNNPNNSDTVAQLFERLEQFRLSQVVEQHKQWLYHFHPSFIGPFVAHYQQTTTNSSGSSGDDYEDEDRVKGELAILTLVAIMYTSACVALESSSHQQHDGHHQDHNLGPLLNALGSAVAAVALRLRFPPAIHKQPHHHHDPASQPQSQPLVTLVTHALSHVVHAASANNSAINQQAFTYCLRACMAAIPDICLGSGGGGARGRMSIDPKCLQEAAMELRTTGINQLWEVLHQHHQQQQSSMAMAHVHENIIIICERWARFLPLPLEFLQHTVPLAGQYISTTNPREGNIRKAALAYLVAIYEGATMTPEKILSRSLGISPEQSNNNQQAGKKRQTSKSKRRQKELLDTHATGSLMELSQAEVYHRGEMACQTTLMIWEALRTAFFNTLAVTGGEVGVIEIEGEGPIGCIAAASNACLPHLLRNPSASTRSKELFLAVSEAFQELCKSHHRVIRAFSMEPIFSLHAAMIEHLHSDTRDDGMEQSTYQNLDADFQAVLVNHFFKCAMNLATACGYPADYFHDTGAVSDEELEIERNDVRDVLRTVTVSDSGGSTSSADCSRPPLDVTLQVLASLLKTCAESIQEAQKAKQLFPETAAHCFSALAKPLNQLSKSYARFGQPDGSEGILKLALHTLACSLQIVIDAFAVAPMADLFPASRVVDIAIASLSPMISNLCSPNSTFCTALSEDVERVVTLSLRAAALSIANIPELSSASLLGHNLYDIRGAMRGPGGEDHVGCLAIMRMAFESEDLARKIVTVSGTDVLHLCQLHAQLKAVEVARGKGVFHGQGVAPKSRRILLGIICHMEIVTNGAAGCAAMLTELFSSAVTAIAASSQAMVSPFDDEAVVYQMVENAFDLSAFSPVIVASVFRDQGKSAAINVDCLRALAECLCSGYRRLLIDHEPTPVDTQWNRLRAAFFNLISTATTIEFPDVAVGIIEMLNRAECEAIHKQCQAGPLSSSSLFNEEIVSDETIPTGIFVYIVGNVIRRLSAQTGDVESVRNCLLALHKSKPYVLASITLACPEPESGKFLDPRPTLCEAWFLTMCEAVRLAGTTIINEDPVMQELVVESCHTAVALLFFPVIGKTREMRSNGPFMSLDGPQTLAINEFFAACFALGPGVMQLIGQELFEKVPVDCETANQHATGVAIVGAALFRAMQGGLPPYAVESLPTTLESFFIALNRDADAFGQMLDLSMRIRLSSAANPFGSVQPGNLLSGPLFETITEVCRRNFLKEALENCKLNSATGWKRLKVQVKQVSGGKKKDTDFNQKPAPTKFEFDRL